MTPSEVVKAVFLVLITLAIGETYADTSPPIQVQLRSPWPSPPLLLEILEAAHEEQPSSFFTLLSHITSPWALTGDIKDGGLESKTIGRTLQKASEETIHHAAKRILDERDLLTDRGQRQNFDLSLALKSQTPKIAAFWQLYDTNGLQKRWEKASKEDECDSWVDFAGKVICSSEELTKAFESYNGETYIIEPPLVPFDHKFSSSSEHQATLPTAVLYANPFSVNFFSLHLVLTEYALGSRGDSQALQYVLRWKPLPNLNDSYLAGYGAFLDLKKVDYLVIDDRKLTDTTVVNAGGEQTSLLETKYSIEDQKWMEKQLRTSDEDRKQSVGSLTEEELADLAIKAAYTVVSSKEPIKALRQLSQDFPRHGVALARSAPSPSKAFLNELETLQEVTVQGGANGVFLNGKMVTYKEFQPIGLLPLLRSERAIINSLTALNLSTSDAVELLTSSVVAQAYSAEESKVDLFDASDRIERSSVKGEQEEETTVITYWNDLEKEGDPRYLRWSPELKSILRPMYPGSFPVIRRNLFNIVMITDMANIESCTFIADTVQLATSKLAIRWGIVPSNLKDETGASLQLARFFWLAMEKGGVDIAAKYLRRLTAASTNKIQVETAERELGKILHMSSEEITELLPQYNQRESMTRSYLQRLRADDASPGHVFVNGQYMPFGPQTFQFIHQAIATQVQMVAAPIYYGQLSEDADVSSYFYDLPGTHSSRSELLFPSEASAIKTQVVHLDETSVVGRSFINPVNENVNSTVWVAGNLDSKQGAKLLRDVALIMDKTSTRLGLIHTPSQSSSKQSSMLLSTFLYQLLTSSTTVTPEQLSEVLDAYQGDQDSLREATTEEQIVLNDATGAINNMRAQGWSAPQASKAAQYWDQDELRKKLDVGKEDFALIINGKVISKFHPEDLSSADYKALFEKEATKVGAVVQILSDKTVVDANLATRAASVLQQAYFVDASLEGIFDAPPIARSTVIDGINFQETAFTFGNKVTASLRFSILVDSISETAQLWSSVLEMLSGFDDVFVKVILNPTPVLKELPIKRYYRHSAPHNLTFDAQGRVKPELLGFADMPMDAVLTMGLEAPPSWLTMAADAIYDLDNIRLKDVVTSSVSVIYDLKYILIEGHAREEVSKGIPRGLQIVLETMDGSEQLDTIVMANLAYFQFRARPGLYRLRLRQGRSTELFDMVSVGNAGYESPRVEETGQSITLSTLQGLTIYPRLARKKGKEKEILVEEEGSDGVVKEAVLESSGDNIFARAKGLLQTVTGKPSLTTSNEGKDVQSQATVNVFTVASGHLYERMTYIMILSVVKHTTSTVKFWFIENFLSPSFKDFIPHLAQEYGFEYELITYAWPHWLRAQKEKQREIWGMKVLFLDVIFPLSLSKVIFVDADQIVRADLKELIDIDLHGAPYGFPPMGNDSYDMDNFRFWEQKGGYWEKFLRGKPYPISALFVVDLNKFRLQAAGDKLRGNYQALTQDPNSLSNLDQDLVASMIHVVEIHSLEKEWLWCETWCSWDWYDRAKSIDLCSNPKTKEPKLDRAKRQIPEWTEYDDEVARAAIKFKEQGKLGANVVAPVAAATSSTTSTSKGEGENQHSISHDEL